MAFALTINVLSAIEINFCLFDLRVENNAESYQCQCKMQSRRIRSIRFSELICTFTVRMNHKIKTIFFFFLAFYALILTSIDEAKSRFYFTVFFESEKLSS